MEMIKVDKKEYEALKRMREANNERVKKFLEGKKKIQIVVTEEERDEMLEAVRRRGFDSIQKFVLDYLRKCIEEDNAKGICINNRCSQTKQVENAPEIPEWAK